MARWEKGCKGGTIGDSKPERTCLAKSSVPVVGWNRSIKEQSDVDEVVPGLQGALEET